MGRAKGPSRQDLVKKILKELRKHPKGIWIRKLARLINEPPATVYKYVMTKESGYPGEHVKIIKRLPQELGGHTMIRLRD